MVSIGLNGRERVRSERRNDQPEVDSLKLLAVVDRARVPVIKLEFVLRYVPLPLSLTTRHGCVGESPNAVLLFTCRCDAKCVVAGLQTGS